MSSIDHGEFGSAREPLTLASLTGDLRVLLDGMGSAPGSAPFEQVLALLGDEWDRKDPFVDGPHTVQGYHAFDSGLRMSLEDGKLYQVLLYLEPQGPITAPYPRIEYLCEQFDVAAIDRAGVLARFGEPYKSKAHWDMFKVGPRLTFLYRPDGTVKSLSILK